MMSLPKTANLSDSLSMKLFTLLEEERALELSLSDLEDVIRNPGELIPVAEFEALMPGLKLRLDEVRAQIAYYRALRDSLKSN